MDQVFRKTRLTEGRFGGVAVGLPLTDGSFWVRRSGCYTIYCGNDRPNDIDYGHPIAIATSVGSFELPSHIAHGLNCDRYYAARAVSSTGREEKGTMSVVRLWLDEAGNRKPRCANTVDGLCVETLEGHQIALYWWYWPIGQAAKPSHFAIYGDNQTGIINFDSPLGQEFYQGAGCYHHIVKNSLEDGEYRFCVRSVTNDGIDDGNTLGVSISLLANTTARIKLKKM